MSVESFSYRALQRVLIKSVMKYHLSRKHNVRRYKLIRVGCQLSHVGRYTYSYIYVHSELELHLQEEVNRRV